MMIAANSSAPLLQLWSYDMMEQLCVGQIAQLLVRRQRSAPTGDGGELHALHIICARSASRFSFPDRYSYALCLQFTACACMNTDSLADERCRSAAPLFI